jgi:hypothetical protein
MPARHIVPAPNASNIGALPLDVLRKILLLLEAKELCRFRLVCREWRSLLSDRYLTAAHFALHPSLLIIAGYTDGAVHDALVGIMDLSGQVVKRVHRMEGEKVMSVPLDHVCVRKIDDSSSRYRLPIQFHEEFVYLPDRLLDPATGVVYHIPYNAAEDVEL